ncbi:MAG: OmpA family protein [Bacteroidetes bacterium]|nr:OmpA family protein [Bacteroidota bacterium]
MRFTTILFLLFSITRSISQTEETSKYCNDNIDKKALKLYEKAKDKKKYKKEERVKMLMEALQIEPDFAEANLYLAQEFIVRCKLENLSFKGTIPYFYKSIASCSQIHSSPYYYIGFYYYEEQKNDSAVKYLKKFTAFKDPDEKKFDKDYEFEIGQAKQMIKSAKKENELRKNVPFNPMVVKGVSTERDEYLAYISPDDRDCFFVRRLPVKDMNKVYTSDAERETFMIAKRDKTGKFNSGTPMPPPFNTTDDNQGGCSISIDNKHLYFAMQKMEGGLQPNIDLYVSDFDGENWSDIRKLSPNVNHPKYWDSQPSIASDGLTLYFASDRPGGYGGIDLYVTTKDTKTGQWSAPKNLGPNINTKGDEKTPFIHSDSETLYFSSNGHYGFGAYDIFYVRKNDKGEWEEPTNIGSPINGATDDTGFFVSGDAKTGYFFSFDEGKVRGKGIGRYDLYSFDLYPEARPQEVALVSGKIIDEKGEAVTGAEVEVKYADSKTTSKALVDSLTGEYMAAINLKKKTDVLISVKKDSVAFNSKIISTNGMAFNKPIDEIKINVSKIEKGKTFLMENIYYQTNSAEIKPESRVVIQAFADYLKENSNIIIQIQGHTDNVGNPKDNDALSNNRAYSVKIMLEEMGISGKRVTARGFGDTQPIAPNNTEAGRAKNRRTEFKITDM